jgi:type IV pilus assembly protein PilM
MAGGGAVWGIDIGQCGLKALRCSLSDDGKSVAAEAFDFIEYPKILSQPDADPQQLIREALAQFLSRNSVRRSKVAISVSGQSGLARFIKLPPVESKKIPDIVRYEARQQIPFALEDVVWDYQQMPGGSEEEGFALETEVGLFAMKRDQVFRAIEPLVDAEVEIDIIQLTPLCIYNAVAFDILADASQEYDPENPPESLVVLSMGTDTSDLVVTNGFRVWQRSVPLGGNHFSKQLMKEMKLTFANAEHLKRNAREAADPKAVFQAMRSVFGDLVTEVQRSVGYFQNIDRTARISRIVMLGNAAKLPGLAQYVGKHLEHEVIMLDSFRHLTGAAVTSSPAFKDNALSFAVCYGLCLQGLGLARLETNLIPREIILQRVVRRKKPWAAAIVAMLLLACTFHFFFRWSAWRSVHNEVDFAGKTWAQAMDDVAQLQKTSSQLVSADADLDNQLKRLNELGEEAVVTTDGRLLWLELLKAINEALPRDPQVPPERVTSLEERPLESRPEMYIQYIESEYFQDLAQWFNDEAKRRYQESLVAKKRAEAPAAATGQEATGALGATGAAAVEPSPVPPAAAPAAVPPDEASTTAGQGADAGQDDTAASADAIQGPTGPGWVIEMKLRHYHNDTRFGATSEEYVRREFLAKLMDGTVDLPVMAPDGTTRTETFTFQELGIRFPFIADDTTPQNFSLRNPSYVPKVEPQRATAGGFGPQPIDLGADPNAWITVKGFECLVQFCWQQTRASEREEKRRQQQSGAGDAASSDE